MIKDRREDAAIAEFRTSLGTFSIRFLAAQAPVTAEYFRSLVSTKSFDGTSIYRIVGLDNAEHRAVSPIQVIQAGLKDTDVQPVAPIRHEATLETGLSHKKWSVSAARFEPNQTYGSFFVCMEDTPSLDHGGARHPDGLGFAAFGEVTVGFDTLSAIYAKREAAEILTQEIAILSATLV